MQLLRRPCYAHACTRLRMRLASSACRLICCAPGVTCLLRLHSQNARVLVALLTWRLQRSSARSAAGRGVESCLAAAQRVRASVQRALRRV
jgi:hypothetical protein